ncbi:MAG: hypothetical protein LC798_04410 [Chloroflexi bacterium]|nr:hypothetical protein [Chloroflexota bacterium]
MTATSGTMARALDLRPGELVRVRPPAQIFATLDADGKLDGLPFMPEMLKYCGSVLPVVQRADKTCAGDGAVRLMPDTVHLQMIRCDGSAHDGCQAACLLFWKEAWLERVAGRSEAVGPSALDDDEQAFVDETLMAGTKIAPRPDETASRYRCQATEIPSASRPLRFRELSQFVRDSRNWRLPKILRGLPLDVFNIYQSISRRYFPERLRIAGGLAYPFVDGRLAKGKTPSGKLDLQPGDLVRIKSKEEIVATLDTTGRNRGLLFDRELTIYCGRIARVQARVHRLIEESNGEMIEIKSDCIILEGVVCAGDFHRFCTRAIYSYWRELWLEKLDPAVLAEPNAPCANRWSRG